MGRVPLSARVSRAPCAQIDEAKLHAWLARWPKLDDADHRREVFTIRYLVGLRGRYARPSGHELKKAQTRLVGIEQRINELRPFMRGRTTVHRALGFDDLEDRMDAMLPEIARVQAAIKKLQAARQEKLREQAANGRKGKGQGGKPDFWMAELCDHAAELYQRGAQPAPITATVNPDSGENNTPFATCLREFLDALGMMPGVNITNQISKLVRRRREKIRTHPKSEHRTPGK